MLVLRPRPSPLHCSYCREGLGESQGVSCAACGVQLHTECWPELKSCPTLGCRCVLREGERETIRFYRPLRTRRRVLQARAANRPLAFCMSLTFVALVLLVGLSATAWITEGGGRAPLWGALTMGPSLVLALGLVERLRKVFLPSLGG